MLKKIKRIVFCHVKINISVPINKVFLENSYILHLHIFCGCFHSTARGSLHCAISNTSPEQQNALGPQALLKETTLSPEFTNFLRTFSNPGILFSHIAISKCWERMGRWQGVLLESIISRFLPNSLIEQTKQPDLQLHHLSSLQSFFFIHG